MQSAPYSFCQFNDFHYLRAMIIVVTVFVYFLVLYMLSRITTRKSNNNTFYRGNRRSPWYMVAFGMIGASISGVTFVSVPGMVMKTDMTYMQTCIGFFFGYIVIATVLLPLYYRLNLTSIYSYLGQRFGKVSYKTGASFFLLSKMTGAAARFYLVCMILQTYVFKELGIPFAVTVMVMVTLIWLYTRRGGIKTLVWTDSFQTFCMFSALILIIINVVHSMNMSLGDAVTLIKTDSHSRIFVFNDIFSKQNFFKQFFSGIFIAVVMTGLDQDMMQKNLTCKTLREAQKDVCTYGFCFIPANLLFLSLGILLMIYANVNGVNLPQNGDNLLPLFAASGNLGIVVLVLFTIGIMAAAFSSADSALTALTTSYCVDIVGKQGDEHLRKRMHIVMCGIFVVCILLFRIFNSTSIIDAIYILCSYTYGPLLGLFAFGLFTKKSVHDRYVPLIAVSSPVICYIIEISASTFLGYKFGYEMLMLNGFLTFLGLYLIRRH
jgi:Na+/proline symporter